MPAPARSALLNVMIRAVEKAGKALVRDFGEVELLQVSRKGPGDFVSQADYKAEKILFDELSHARPNYGFLMEEGGEKIGADKEHVWVIDPLDGTMNFLHGIPYWCVSLALVKNREDVLAGVVYNPISDELFWAEKGMGAYLNAQRLRVSGRVKLDEAVANIVRSGPPKPEHGLPSALYEKLGPQFAAVRHIGASALNLAYCAAGRFDITVEMGAHPWDVAAGTLLVREAGGVVTTLKNKKEVVYGRELIAGPPKLHGAALKKLND